MLDRAFLLAIAGFGVITFGLFCMVVFREFWRSIATGLEHGRRLRCSAVLFPKGEISDESIHRTRAKFKTRDIEPVVAKHVRKHGIEGQSKIELFERTGVVSYFVHALLSSRHWNDRASAALSLGDTGSGKALVPLIGVLEDPDEDEFHVKTAAAHALAMIRDTTAITGLVDALGTRSERVSSSISESLIQFGEKSWEPILTFLQSKPLSGRVGYWLVHTCGRLKAPLFVDSLLQNLDNPDPEIRAAIVDSLGRIGDRRAVHPLIARMLNDPIAGVRTSAAQSLGKISDPRALDSLLRALSDPDNNTRSRAVEALEMLGSEARAALLDTLRDPRKEVRFRAASALERMGAVHHSLQNLGDNSPHLRDKAIDMISGLVRAGVIESVLEGLNHPDFRVRARLCQVLGNLNEVRSVAALIEKLKDPEWPVQARAFRALSKIEGAVVPAKKVVNHLCSDNADIRWAAVSVLTRVPESESEHLINVLTDLIEDNNAVVRLSAIEYLGRLKTEPATRMIVGVSNDPKALVRVAACRALGASGHKGSVKHLIGLLSDKEEQVRIAAALALAKVGESGSIQSLLNVLDTLPVSVTADVLWELGKADLTGVADYLMGAGSPNARKVLIKLLLKAKNKHYNKLVRILISDPDKAIAGTAISLAGIMKDDLALSSIMTHCQSQDSELRKKGVEAMGHIGTKETMNCLISRLQIPDEPLKAEMLEALGRIGLPEAETRVAPFLKSNKFRERISAVLGMGLLGTPTAFQTTVAYFSEPAVKDAVLKRLEKESEEVVTRFFKTFNLHGGKIEMARAKGFDSMNHLYMRELQEAREVSTRVRAAQALGLIGSPECIQVLKRRVREEPNDTVRAQVVTALGRIGDKDLLLEWMSQALHDPSRLVRRSALLYLRQCPGVHVNHKLLDVLRSGEEFVRQEAMEALIDINRGAPNVLMDIAMSERDPELTAMFIDMLTPVIGIGLERLLISLCHHEAESTRAAAVSGLCRIEGLKDFPEVLRQAAFDPSAIVRLALVRNCRSQWIHRLSDELNILLQDPVASIRRETKNLLALGGEIS